MMADAKKLKIWVIKAWGAYAKNQPLDIEVDKDDNPRDRFWARNLESLKKNGFVSTTKPKIEKPAPQKKSKQNTLGGNNND